MKIKQWMDLVESNKDALRGFILAYHPANLAKHYDLDVMAPTITAPNAERACEIVREQIRNECLDFPEIQFDIALQKQDYDTIYSLLSSTWFGVPENTDCWRITGFGIACDLLDDPIEEEYP